MKDYKEMAKSVFERRDKQLKENSRKKAVIVKYVTTVSSMCLAILMSIGIWKITESQKDLINIIEEQSISKTSTTEVSENITYTDAVQTENSDSSKTNITVKTTISQKSESLETAEVSIPILTEKNDKDENLVAESTCITTVPVTTKISQKVSAKITNTTSVKYTTNMPVSNKITNKITNITKITNTTCVKHTTNAAVSNTQISPVETNVVSTEQIPIDTGIFGVPSYPTLRPNVSKCNIFKTITLDRIKYESMYDEFDLNYLGDYIGSVRVSRYYESKFYTDTAYIYNSTNLPDTVFAVCFGNSDEYYSYKKK